MPTTIVTDSTACLPAGAGVAAGIEVIALHVMIGDQEYAEGVDISSMQVAQALRSSVPVTTSRPAPAAFLEAYERAAAAGATEIVSTHLSGALSSTFSGAQLAARSASVPVTVVDSRALGMAMGYAVQAGARRAAEGAPGQEVAELIERTALASSTVFYVDTLEFLRRGGRIGRASALLGSAFAIKPILALDEGQIVPLEKVRTASKAIARLEELAVAAAQKAGARVEIAVQHLDSEERARLLAERLSARVATRTDRVEVVELGAVVGAHVGPGTLAVAVVPSRESRP